MQYCKPQVQKKMNRLRLKLRRQKLGRNKLQLKKRLNRQMSFGLSIAGGNKVKLTVHMGKDSFIEVIKEKPNSR